MGGDFVADDARADILFIGQTKVFLGRHVAEHRGPVPADLAAPIALVM